MKISIEINTEDPVEVRKALHFLQNLLSLQTAYEPEESEVAVHPVLKKEKEFHITPAFSKVTAQTADDFLKEVDDEESIENKEAKKEEMTPKKEEKPQAPAKQSTTVSIIDEEF